MKLTPVVLGVSLVANAALAGVLVWFFADPATGYRPGAATRGDVRTADPEVGAPGSPDRPIDAAALAAALAASGTDRASADGVARLVALFNSGDAGTLATALRAAGVSEDIIRAVVREQISARYRARIRAIQEGANPGDRPYWQNAGRQMLSAEQRGEIRDLQRAMRDEIERALGEEANDANRGGRFAYLPSDKSELLAQIESDYNDLQRETRESMQGFRLPSDEDTIRLLQEERRRDIEALLTPEELAAFDQRNSPSAQRVRNQYGAVIQSEEQYLAIYRLQQAFDEQIGSAGFDRRERAQAEEALRTQVLEILAPEQRALYAQQRDPDFQTMQAASVRLNLPPEATQRVMALRAQLAGESQTIAASATLDAAAKETALAALAAQARTALRQTMGAEGGDAFAQRAEWIRALERGASFSERPEGGVAVSGGRGRGGPGGGAGPQGGPGGGGYGGRGGGDFGGRGPGGRGG